jgi:YggT family protein
VSYLIWAFNIAIIGRVIMSWVSPRGDDPISSVLIQITEPLLAPIRRVLPRFGMFDLSPMVAVIVLYILGSFVRVP